MGLALRDLVWVPFAIVCTGCAIVDDFEPRVYSADVQSQNVMNKETLLNIVRASWFHPLNFVQITQVAGQQTEDFKIGLPTITFGPSKTGAAKQFAFSGNALDNSIQGSFQSNPLVTSAFQQGMMSAISPKVMALLIESYGREPVFLATFEKIDITVKKEVKTFRNDPGNDIPRSVGGSCVEFQRPSEPGDPLENYTDEPDVCNFSKFLHFLRLALAYGTSFELISSGGGGGSTTSATATAGSGGTATATAKGGKPSGPGSKIPAASPVTSPAAATSQTSNATSSASASGRLCYDPGLAQPRYRKDISSETNRCGLGEAAGPGDLTVLFRGRNNTILKTNVTFLTRSPLGVYSYFGKLLRMQRDYREPSITYSENTREMLNQPYFTIRHDLRGDTACLVDIEYLDENYCAPTNAYSTSIVLAILQDLRNLSVTPADLNASFSVRVSN